MGSFRNPTDDPPRAALRAILKQRGISYQSLSEQIGRNSAYIHQYLEGGKPLRLKEDTRQRIAEALDVDETLLGGPPHRGRSDRDSDAALGVGVRAVPEYNALVAAGGGVMIDEEERTGTWPLPSTYLEEMHLSGNALAVVPVKGDSMEPTLRSGDRVLVDLGDRNISQGGLFALFDGLGRVVKRVEHIPGTRPPKLALISDNPLHSKYEVNAEEIGIIGRVVWAARRL